MIWCNINKNETKGYLYNVFSFYFKGEKSQSKIKIIYLSLQKDRMNDLVFFKYTKIAVITKITIQENSNKRIIYKYLGGIIIFFNCCFPKHCKFFSLGPCSTVLETGWQLLLNTVGL